MLVDVLVAGVDLVQGVHGVDGYVGSEGGVGGKGLFSSPPSPPSVGLCLNPSDSTRDKAKLGLLPAVSGSLLT